MAALFLELFHYSKSEKWEFGTQELRLFVEAAERMSSAQRRAFTNALAPRLVSWWDIRHQPIGCSLKQAHSLTATGADEHGLE